MDLPSQPLVTIAALNYNNERFVIETLESIRAQTYGNVELIIIDDCSVDNSPRLIKEWLKSYDKPYRFIEHESNQGIAIGAQKLLDNSNGKYLSLIATDDLLLPEKTAEQVDILERCGAEYAMVYGHGLQIDEASNLLTDLKWQNERWRDPAFVPPSGNIFIEVVKGIYFYTQSTLINLDLLRKTGFRYDRKIMADDYDLELTLTRNYKAYGSPKAYFKYRRVVTSFSTTYVQAERIQKLYTSLIYMFMRYVNHPLNTSEENTALLGHVRSKLWDLENTPGFTQKDRVLYLHQIFKKSRRASDLKLLLKAAAARVLQMLKKAPATPAAQS